MSDIFNNQEMEDSQQVSFARFLTFTPKRCGPKLVCLHLINFPFFQTSPLNRQSANVLQRFKQQVKALNDKVKSLTEENKCLREINIQNQLENFKLKQKIEKLESSLYEEQQSYEIVHNNYENTYDSTVEYIEDSNIAFEEVEEKNFVSKRTYSDAFDESEMIEHEIQERDDTKEEYLMEEELHTEDEGLYYSKDEQDEKSSIRYVVDTNYPHIDPEEAFNHIYNIATSKGAAEKFKQIASGRQGDSTFINKCLEFLFDRMVLANSSTRGQKFQGKYDVAPKPALDPRKLNICRQAFAYRLNSEGTSTRDDRFKAFHGHVNSKIQNTRKCVKKQKTPIRGFTH